VIIQKENRVRVNIAPFIGSLQPSKESIPCRVLEVKDASIKVATEFPFRDLSMWVSSLWIEEVLELDFRRHREDNSTEDLAFKDGKPRERTSLMPVG